MSSIPFFVNVRMEKVAHLMSYMDIYTEAGDIEVLQEDIMNLLNQCRKDITNASKIRKTWGDNTISEVMCNNLQVYLAAGMMKMRSGDIDGLRWCVTEVLKEVGYTPSPLIRLRKALKA